MYSDSRRSLGELPFPTPLGSIGPRNHFYIKYSVTFEVLSQAIYLGPLRITWNISARSFFVSLLQLSECCAGSIGSLSVKHGVFRITPIWGIVIPCHCLHAGICQMYPPHYKTPPLRNLCFKLCHVYVPEWRPRQPLFFSLVNKTMG